MRPDNYLALIIAASRRYRAEPTLAHLDHILDLIHRADVERYCATQHRVAGAITGTRP